jgi:ketosteroid isomerase-like protein
VTDSPNLDLVRSIYAGWERGDFSSVEWAHPEIEYVLTGGIADGSWTGLAGMADGWRNYLSAWEEYQVELDRFRELDDERVLVVIYVSGRGRISGLDIGQVRTRAATLFHLRDGRVTRLVVYADGDRALADLGLPPEADSQP